MITHLRGQLSDLNPTSVVVDCSGIGYLVNISLNTYSYLGQQKGEVKIFTLQIIREDAHQLYGFSTTAERELFSLLISVSGIGPNTARIILSQYTPNELNTILSLGQVDALKAVKGIGLKTAQRIILELKGKLNIEHQEDNNDQISTSSSRASTHQRYDEAIAALKMLGYPETAAQKAVRDLSAQMPEISVEDLIKKSLKIL